MLFASSVCCILLRCNCLMRCVPSKHSAQDVHKTFSLPSCATRRCRGSRLRVADLKGTKGRSLTVSPCTVVTDIGANEVITSHLMGGWSFPSWSAWGTVRRGDRRCSLAGTEAASTRSLHVINQEFLQGRHSCQHSITAHEQVQHLLHAI